MKVLRRFFLWGLVFCLLLAAVDQALLRVPLTAPGLHAVQVFYRDFRSRLLAMFGAPAGPSIEQVIGAAEGRQSPVPPAAGSAPTGPRVQPSSSSPRYLYVDQDGALQFADSLQQVPARFRASAQPLKD